MDVFSDRPVGIVAEMDRRFVIIEQDFSYKNNKDDIFTILKELDIKKGKDFEISHMSEDEFLLSNVNKNIKELHFTYSNDQNNNWGINIKYN